MKTQFTILGLRFTLEIKRVRVAVGIRIYYPKSSALRDQLKEVILNSPPETPVEKITKSESWFNLWEAARQEGNLSLVNGMRSIEFVYAHRSPSYGTLGELRHADRRIVRGTRDLSLNGYDIMINIFGVPNLIPGGMHG